MDENYLQSSPLLEIHAFNRENLVVLILLFYCRLLKTQGLIGKERAEKNTYNTFIKGNGHNIYYRSREIDPSTGGRQIPELENPLAIQ